MTRVQAGDEAALGELLGRWRSRLYAFLWRRAGDAADDLFQETWLRVVRAAERFDPQRRFSTWLFQIANNLCRDRARRGAVAEAHRDAMREEMLHDPRRLEAPALDLRLDMHRRIHALPERLREVLLLRYYHQLSEAEIADVVGIPRGTVKSRLHHAVRALRGQEPPEPGWEGA